MKPLKSAQHFSQEQIAAVEIPKARQQLEPQPLLPLDDMASPEPSASSRFSVLWLAALCALLALISLGLWQWTAWLTQQWQQSLLAGTLVSLFTGAVLTILLVLCYREWRLWRQLQRNQQWQQQAQRIAANVQFGEALPLCDAILRALPPDALTQTAIADWRAAIKPEHSDIEILTLFEQQLLQPLDRQAQQLIWRGATDSSLAVAISPFALADMLLVLWRSSRMLRQLARLYGAPVGQLRSLVLIKQAIATLLWAGSSELALDMAADVLSSELTAKLSARAGQGVVAGLLVARLGNIAMMQLRPLPLAQSQKIQPAQLAKALVGRFSPAEPTANKS